MISFDGFEHVLMSVIRQTAHEDVHLTDEQRFDAAMLSIFGKQYKKWHEDTPADFNIGEVIAVQNLIAFSKLSRRDAVWRVKGLGERPKDPATRREFNAELTRLCDQIRHATERKSDFYKNFSSVDSDWDLEPNQYEGREEMNIRREKRNSIFAALRNAGWSI